MALVAKAEAAQDVIAAAELAEEGGGAASLPSQCMARFQELFECPRLEGVLPAINKVYVEAHAARNFRRNVASLLGLDEDTTPGKCMANLQVLLDALEAVQAL